MTFLSFFSHVTSKLLRLLLVKENAVLTQGFNFGSENENPTTNGLLELIVPLFRVQEQLGFGEVEEANEYEAHSNAILSSLPQSLPSYSPLVLGVLLKVDKMGLDIE